MNAQSFYSIRAASGGNKDALRTAKQVGSRGYRHDNVKQPPRIRVPSFILPLTPSTEAISDQSSS